MCTYQVPMLRMMEPELEEDFKPGQKKRQGSRELLEEQKMRHKLKQVQRFKKRFVLYSYSYFSGEKRCEEGDPG